MGKLEHGAIEGTMITMIVVGVIILGMAGAIHYYKSELQVVTAQYEGFKETVKANGEAAIAKAALKEKEHEITINDALGVRDDALNQLRLAQAAARAAGGRVPLLAAPAQASGTICFDQKALSAAVERYRDRIFDLVVQGDEAAIDAQTLINAWPK